MEQQIFVILAGGALASAAAMVMPNITKSPVHAALALVVCFLFLSGLFALLSAHVLAAIQVLVYAGAVMVLFVFVIMLLNLSGVGGRPMDLTSAKVLAGLLILFGVGKIWSAVELPAERFPRADLSLAEHEGFGTLEAVADGLFSTYLVPFELLGMLLLVALIGAVVLAKKRLSLEGEEAQPTDGAQGEGS
jgi:NADH-quinone oxidoreductase subunit J